MPSEYDREEGGELGGLEVYDDACRDGGEGGGF